MTVIDISLSLKPYGAGAGGASLYDPASDLIFASFVTPPTTARKVLIDQCVRDLKTAGVWAKLDALYAFAAADNQAAKINWKAPGTFNCTEVNAPTFTADQGFTGAATKHIDSGFNPTTAPSPKFTQNDASAFSWSLTAASSSAGGIMGSPNRTILMIPHAAGINYFGLNCSGFLQGALADGSGLHSTNRTSSSTLLYYRNGANAAYGASGSLTSVAPFNEDIWFLRDLGNSWVTGTVAAGGFGSQLSAADNTALYNALAAYMAGLATDRIAVAFTTPPSAARKTLIQNCVTSLMQTGVWDKLDALYAFAAADSQAAIINWKQPGTYNCSEINTPTFTADQGFTGASTKYLDSGFNASTATTPKFVRNDAHVSGWSLTAAQQNACLWGLGSSATTQFKPAAASAYWVLLNGATEPTAASSDASGLFNTTRTSATSLSVYRNGSLLNTHADNSVAVTNETLRFLASAATSFVGQIAAGSIGQSLNATEQTALYNALRTYMLGLTPVANSETTAIISAFTNPPSPARTTLIDNCVGSLKTAGVWAKLDALYAFAAADSQAALINWKNPGTFNGTLVNAPTFTADRGFTGASTKYLDSGFNGSTAPSPKYVQNSACAFGYSLSSYDGGGLVGTTVDGPINGDTTIYPYFTGTCYYLITQNPNSSVASSDSIGLFSVNRSGASATTIYKNGSSLGTDTAASSAPVNANTTFLRRGGTYYGGQIGCGGIGSSLNSTEQTALYNALRTYLTGVGVP